MPAVTGKARIALPLEACWAKLRDLSRGADYVPGVKTCEITSELREGVGASRVVDTEQSGKLSETVIAWDEGRGFTLNVHKRGKAPVPFAALQFTYALVPVDEACEVHTKLEYETAWGPVGWLIDRLVLRRAVSSNAQDVAEALARYYESSPED